MKMKYLFATAAVIIGVAAYTLTLSFTETPSAISRLEALANGEGGESGGGNEGEKPETGGENPESGQTKGKYKPEYIPVVCTISIIEKDLNGNDIGKYEKTVRVQLIKGCPEGVVATTCALQDCTAVSSF